jgi:hypothetical protein
VDAAVATSAAAPPSRQADPDGTESDHQEGRSGEDRKRRSEPPAPQGAVASTQPTWADTKVTEAGEKACGPGPTGSVGIGVVRGDRCAEGLGSGWGASLGLTVAVKVGRAVVWLELQPATAQATAIAIAPAVVRALTATTSRVCRVRQGTSPRSVGLLQPGPAVPPNCRWSTLDHRRK